MESFVKKVFENKSDKDCHRYFVRFGRGVYKKRFLISLNKGSIIKIRASFEFANDFVRFVKENKDVKFSGSILMKDKVYEKYGKKKRGVFVYEVSESNIDEFKDAYYYLLNANSGDIVLKIKKSLQKPGKDADKIDNKFCVFDLDIKYWPKVKEAFFWDVLDSVKKVKIEHELQITDIELPINIDDPEKMRELAKRKGRIIRKISFDGKEEVREKEFVV